MIGLCNFEELCFARSIAQILSHSFDIHKLISLNFGVCTSSWVHKPSKKELRFIIAWLESLKIRSSIFVLKFLLSIHGLMSIVHVRFQSSLHNFAFDEYELPLYGMSCFTV